MVTAERRKHSRQEAIPANRAAVIWGSVTSDGENRARLLDISRGGARLEMKEPPPPGQLLWLRLESPVTTTWVAARPVRREGADRLAVRFDPEANDDWMLAATLGIALDFRLGDSPL